MKYGNFSKLMRFGLIACIVAGLGCGQAPLSQESLQESQAFVRATKKAVSARLVLGFMLPVSTPPNAIVYGTGHLPLKEMFRSGIFFDVLGLIIISVFMLLLYPYFLLL